MRESTSPEYSQIHALLEQLKANDASRRESAAKKLGKWGIKTEAIVPGLNEMARDDPNPYPRRAARAALSQLGETSPSMEERDFTIAHPIGLDYEDTAQRMVHLGIGFLGWFVLNGIGWFLAVESPGSRADYGSIFLLLGINLIACVALLVLRRWVCFGFAAAYLLNFLVGVLGQFTNSEVALGVPFFISVR